MAFLRRPHGRRFQYDAHYSRSVQVPDCPYQRNGAPIRVPHFFGAVDGTWILNERHNLDKPNKIYYQKDPKNSNYFIYSKTKQNPVLGMRLGTRRFHVYAILCHSEIYLCAEHHIHSEYKYVPLNKKRGQASKPVPKQSFIFFIVHTVSGLIAFLRKPKV